MSDDILHSNIVTDIEEDEPIFGFDHYAEAIAGIITSSEPSFTIGIYGEWGTGKTTLMKLIQHKLGNDKDELLTVWFNAWRYEREEDLSIIALMKTIAFAVDRNEHYRQLKPLFLRGVKLFGKDLLRQVASTFITDRGIKDFEEKLLPKLEHLAEIDKDTIYFDGIRKIEEAMEEFPGRIVVFIDDLDRCSPKKVLEVFESIKVFLGIKGFIYVIGLSHVTISKVITAEYKTSEISGEHYIKKIIQIPIVLPQWSSNDIKPLIQKLSYRLSEQDQILVEENADLIAQIVEGNPREAKSFINSFVIAKAVYSRDSNMKDEELLLVHALNQRWNEFYNFISGTDEEFRENLRKILEESEGDSSRVRESITNEQIVSRNYLKNLERSLTDSDLWTFLYKHRKVILAISDWKKFRPVTSLIKVPRTYAKFQWPVYAIGEVVRTKKDLQWEPNKKCFVEEILEQPENSAFGGKYSLFALEQREKFPGEWYMGDWTGDEITSTGKMMSIEELNEYKRNVPRYREDIDFVIANLGRKDLKPRKRL